MNEIYARRFAQTMMFQQLMRCHGTMWAAARVTKEKMDWPFVKEEFMRANGERAMPLLIKAASDMQQLSNCHWNTLMDNGAWAESFRAYCVRRQTPLTQRCGALGRMAVTIPSVQATSLQHLVLEQLSRVEGCCAERS